jgi:exodeoxyribonuclease VII small subunit
VTSGRSDASALDPSDPASGTDAPGAGGDPGAAGVSSLTFDEALAELQVTVAALEEGGLPLERTLELYERGVLLHERCARLLGDAEMRVRRLVDGASGGPELTEEADADTA